MQPTLWKRVVAQSLSLLSWALIAYVFLGERLFGMLGLSEPAWLLQIKESKMGLMMGYFGCNMITQQLQSTGAFEVFLDGREIFSKIATGRPPAIDELALQIASAGVLHVQSAAEAYGIPL